ncbi:hypothetical protein, partial [Parafrankia sp. EUN1f]
HVDALRSGANTSYLDLVIVVSSAIVWAASSGTSTPTTEGLPGWYGNATFVVRGGPARRTVQAGDIAGGTVTFAIAAKAPGAGLLYASSGYPLSWEIQNLGPEPA